jgi:hypothetical protein
MVVSSLAGGEPQELVAELRRTTHSPLSHASTGSLSRLHRGVAAGVTPPHHRPSQHTQRHLGRLGRPGPARRLALGGLAAPKISGGAVDHADPIPAWLRAEHQFVNDLVAVGWTLRNGDRAMVSAGYSVCDLGYGVGQLALLLRDTRS